MWKVMQIYLLNPYLMWNTQGQYTPIFLIYSVVEPWMALNKGLSPKRVNVIYYLPLVWSLLIFVCSVVQCAAWEIHNIMLSPPEEGGPKEARYAYNNITISYYALHSIMPPQLKNMPSRYKGMGGCECCISAKSIIY